MKQPRPDIPKLAITNIGTFDNDGNPIGWSFDGSSHPRSVGEFFSLVNADGSYDWHLIGGYTVEELREIANTQQHTKE